MAGEAPSNLQSQTQQQAITISVESAGDPDLEHRIFSQVHSAGRQLRNLSAVVEVLLAAHEATDPVFAQANEARAAVDAFKKRGWLAGELRPREATRVPVSDLSHLQPLNWGSSSPTPTAHTAAPPP